MTALANAMGCRWEYQSANDIQVEIMKLLPGYYNLGQPRKVVPVLDQYLSNGYATEVKARYQRTPPSARTSASFFSSDGAVISAFGEIVYASAWAYQDRSEHREVADEYTGHGTSWIARRCEGAFDFGSWFPSARCAAGSVHCSGTCFFPEHFNEPPVKDLMPVSVDTTTGVPSFKQIWVSVEPGVSGYLRP